MSDTEAAAGASARPASDSSPSGYPARWEADVVLRDGGTVHVRPVVPADGEAVRAFHARQSRESIYFRYFSPMPKLSVRELERLTKVDYVSRMAFVALLGDDIVAMASYDIFRDASEAEVAFIVDEPQQGRGLATVLLEYLMVAARENGLRGLTAQVLPTNRRMLSVFQHAGFEVSSTFEEGVIEVRLGIEPTEQSLAAIEDRAQRAEARSVERLLHPETIAVIGAGRSPGGIGHEVFRNLVARGFNGPVFPVNPHGGHVASVRAYGSVLDIVDEVDLAIVAVPAASVSAVVEECAQKRVRGLVIISAGLDGDAPGGRPADGHEPPMSRVITDRALGSGMRVIGPDSMGIINTAPGVSLHGTFAPVEVTAGEVGFLTQSGTLGVAALEHAQRMGVGISAFVDIGSRTDVSGNDLLQFWDRDERTSVVLLYLESFGNPRKFTRIARRMARTKPIVAVKSGRGLPLAPDLQDGGLADMWPADATVGALLAQSGVIRVDTPTELFSVARVLVRQPVPQGRRVGIISNARGAAVLTTDACIGAGLEVAELSTDTIGRLSGRVPSGATLANPVDLSWEAGPSDYRLATDALLADPGVDAVLVVYAPPIRERWGDVARAIGSAHAHDGAKPVLATFLGSEIGLPLVSGAATIPLFEFPDEAARVLGHLADYAAWRSQPEGTLHALDDDVVAALEDFIASILAESPDGRWLNRDEGAELMRLAGLHPAEHRMVSSADEAVTAADGLGYPVVLKATGVERYHRGEEGGVALDLHDADALRAAFERMAVGLGDAMRVAVVQQLASPGADVLVAAHQHAAFGAVLSLGIGGVMAAANSSLPVRILPLSDTDAHRLVVASPVAGLLEREANDSAATRACEDFLVRVAAVLDVVPEIADLLLNPVIVGAGGATVADAWIRVAPYRLDGGPAVRRL